jgi:hypothetical protein
MTARLGPRAARCALALALALPLALPLAWLPAAVRAGAADAPGATLGLTAAGRAALGAEIRALIRAEPGLIGDVLQPPDPYEQAVSEDLALLARLAPALFDPAAEGFGPADAAAGIALFIRADCPDCARAAAELQSLSESHALRVTLHRPDSDPAAAALAAELGLTESPAYVLPGMMLQGHIPAIVLQRYLSR